MDGCTTARRPMLPPLKARSDAEGPESANPHPGEGPVVPAAATDLVAGYRLLHLRPRTLIFLPHCRAGANMVRAIQPTRRDLPQPSDVASLRRILAVADSCGLCAFPRIHAGLWLYRRLQRTR